MEGFEYKMGDVVLLKAGIADSLFSCRTAPSLEWCRIAHYFAVVGLLADTCDAGTQRSYKLARDGETTRHHCLEVATKEEENAYIEELTGLIRDCTAK